jgi:DNA repair protein RadC
MNKINSEDATAYNAKAIKSNASDQVIIDKALAILDGRIKHGDALCSPTDTSQYLRLQLAQEKAEVFCCLFLDNRNRVISFDRLFAGTIDGASVYPREVVRACINHNAAAVILAHNHPSGVTEPSRADEQITKRLKEALTLIDVRVLDHVIIGDEIMSFAERGLL